MVGMIDPLLQVNRLCFAEIVLLKLIAYLHRPLCCCSLDTHVLQSKSRETGAQPAQ